MSSVATELRSLRSQFPEHRAQLGLSLRVTIAVLSGFAVLHLLKVPLPLWTVVTAVVLTQATFGRSVKATIDYLVGTLGGALYAGAVAILVPHSNDVSLACVLALAVSLLVLPARAHSLVIEGAARTLDLMAGSLPELFEGFIRPRDAAAIARIQDSIGEGVARMRASAAEAQHERIVF